MSWLVRLKEKNSEKPPGSGVAKGAKGTLATLAPGVAGPFSENSPHDADRRILAWLAYIEETDPEIIAEVLEKCRRDPEALSYFLRRAEEVLDDDPKRSDREFGLLWCQECQSFRGYSQACSKGYAPTPKTDWRRCEDFSEE